MHRQNLGEMLVAANLIDEVQMQIAVAEQSHSGKRFGSTLIELKFIDENVLAAFLSKQIDVPCISLLHIDIPKKVLRKMQRELCIESQAIPVRITDDGKLELAMVNPMDVSVVARVEETIGMTVSPLVAPESSILTLIEKFYPEQVGDDITLSARQKPSRNTPSDPEFLDLIEDLESQDLEGRLGRIEENLSQIWTLLERILRALEERNVQEPVGRERS